MNRLATICGAIFGAMMIALSIAIAAETILRKFFSYSMGGIDELGGYAVAVGAPLAFLVAATHQAHIRINILHAKLPPKPRAILNVVAAASLTVLALFLAYFAFTTTRQTFVLGSIAQTPWATPLIYPQSVWLIAIATFALGTIWLSIRAIVLLCRRDWPMLVASYGPGSAQEELEAELADLQTRERT